MSARLPALHHTFGPPGAQRGFVLVLTLWVLVIVAIAAGYFSERVALSIELAQQSRQNTAAIIDMAGTRAEILYRLGTSSMTEYGLGRGSTAVNLDDRLYKGLGSTVVRVQDSRGLLNLNLTDDDRMQRFLGLMGIPAERRGTMIDTLRDYIQSARTHRLNGAGDEDYAALGLALPSHRDLITPWEAKRIIGWRDAPQLWEKDRLVNLTTTSQSLGINPNTAPAEVLATLPGVTEELAQTILTRRKIAPFTYEGQITDITLVPLNLPMGMGVIVIPSDTVRITQATQGLPWAVQYIVKLTPNGKNGPWRTDYYSRVSTPVSQEVPTDIQPLPARSDASPEKAPSFLTGG
jgi:general secretion pathway protein K